MPKQNIERWLINQSPIQHNDRQTQDFDSTPKKHMASSEEDWFNESILTLLGGQQDFQKQSLEMMQNMTRCNEYNNLMRDITVYDRKKKWNLADWLLQIEKVAVLTNSKEYELATKKLTSTPYKMLQRMEDDLSWQEIKKKLEEVYSP